MKELAEAIKKETGDYSLIEDLMAQVVGERFGGMTSGDVKAVMGKEGEGAEAGKCLKQEGSKLVIKGEPGGEVEKVVISAIVPSEEPTLLPYCIKENEEEDCETIGSESDIKEIDKTEVRNILKELAEKRRNVLTNWQEPCQICGTVRLSWSSKKSEGPNCLSACTK